MLPQRIAFQPSVGRSIPSDLLRAMPGHWQLRELAGAYVNGNGRFLNVSSEPARCNRPASNAPSSRTEQRPNDEHRSTGFIVVSHSTVSRGTPPCGFVAAEECEWQSSRPARRGAAPGCSRIDSNATCDPDGDHGKVWVSVNVPHFRPFPCLARVKVPVMVWDVVSS
jgi:hypothetical protein